MFTWKTSHLTPATRATESSFASRATIQTTRAGEQDRSAGSNIVLSLALIVLGSLALVIGWHGNNESISSAYDQTIEGALGDDPATHQSRLIQTSETAWSDLNVEFMLRDEGNTRANRSAAMHDVLNLARTVYGSDTQRPPLSLTVLGFAARSASVESRVPILYASVPADRWNMREWMQFGVDELESRSSVRWLPIGLCEAWQECALGDGQSARPLAAEAAVNVVHHD
jgi:hypothetical protein